MRDTHRMVVDDICKIIGGVPVGLDEDLVLQLAVFHRNTAVHGVFKRCGAVKRHFLADNVGHPFF